MTSIKIKFRPSAVKGKEGILYFQITHQRVTRQIATTHRVYAHEWLAAQQCVVTYKGGHDRRQYLDNVTTMLDGELRLLSHVISRYEVCAMPYTADVVANEYRRLHVCHTLMTFMQRVIQHLVQNGQHCTARNYQSALRSFMRFRGGTDMPVNMLDALVVQAFEAWLKRQGICRNTSSFYMRILRAVYNRAVDSGITGQCHPFARVYTGNDTTRKRAVDIVIIKTLKQTDLSARPQLDLARDLFMLSFYLRGMSFVDLAHLRKSNLCNGYLRYTRSKTGQKLCIKWEQPMQRIVEKYAAQTKTCDWLLPILHDNPTEQTYHCVQMRMGLYLKKVARMAGIQGNLTFYTARHSWATIAHDNHAPISVISEALGHDSERTTQIYLRSIQTAEVDKTNANILAML